MGLYERIRFPFDSQNMHRRRQFGLGARDIRSEHRSIRLQSRREAGPDE